MFQLCTVKGYIERKVEVKEKPGQAVKIIPMTPRMPTRWWAKLKEHSNSNSKTRDLLELHKIS